MDNQSQVENLLEVDIYSGAPLQTGLLACPFSMRIIDLLNNRLFQESGDNIFLEIMDLAYSYGNGWNTVIS